MTDGGTSKQPRFQHPRVMMIDLPSEALDHVRDAGYRVTAGSMGNTYTTQPARRVVPTPEDTHLPGFAEQEVVVLQAAQRQAVVLDSAMVPTATTNTVVWADLEAGEFDTRSVSAIQAADFAQRILAHGGVFVVFCDFIPNSHLRFRQMDPGGYFREDHPMNSSVYALIHDLDAFSFKYDSGEEIQSAGFGGTLGALDSYMHDAVFRCSIDPGDRRDNFAPLARNKFGHTVAGLFIVPGSDSEDEDSPRGLVFLLPQVANPGACVTTLLDSVLPTLAPRLFPESENASWLHEPDYELPEVLDLEHRIAVVQTQAAKQEDELREKIAQQRVQLNWMHDLLAETGDKLVTAVAIALAELGLQDVREVDDEAEDAAEGRRREDIQVWCGDPMMIVEVKGIHGLPKEAQALQVQKYFLPRMRKWKLEDIRGLSVVNQQRGLPPLNRENTHVFQDDVLLNADEQHFGLVTTIDLFRLVRNRRRWHWPADTVAPLFYENGRIEPIPTHYEEVGTIDGYFERVSVVTITLTSGAISVGDEIAFRLPIDYEQESVQSMQVDDVSVERVEAGQQFGLKTTLTKAQARNGVKVYRVISGNRS